MILCIAPLASANSVGVGVGIDIGTEDFEPRVWLCDSRYVSDDHVQWGRISPGDTMLFERKNNYAFEGESIHWRVLVMDKNGIEKIEDVFVTLGDVQGMGNNMEANCFLSSASEFGPECNARLGQEVLCPSGICQLDLNTQRIYDCYLTVETSDSMYGEYWATVEAVDLDGLSGVMDENEYWFFNPVIELLIEGDIVFQDVRPGTEAYSGSLLIGNAADKGSGVVMDMFISGTDFYDSSSSGAMCPNTNRLSLQNFRYYSANGGYSTYADTRADSEGYVGINYGDHWDRSMYNNDEILQAGPILGGTLGYTANLLTPGSEMALTFKLNLPEPCNGDFDTGSIFFWGEAV